MRRRAGTALALVPPADTMAGAMRIRLAHSPDADDAFMFYGLAAGKVDTGEYDFEHVLEDIQTLNDRASRGEMEITAISAHAYAYVRDQYVLTRCGGSFGDDYGPMIVSREPVDEDALSGKTVAVPGTTTSAFLALELYRPGLRTKMLPFDKIVPAVQAGVVDCGLIIHEAQVTYEQQGLHCAVDLGKWWRRKTDGLPLPLGCNAIRKDIAPEARAELARIIVASIEYGLAHRAEAVGYAMRFAGDMDESLAERFVGMYVNDLTLDMGDRGQRAIEEFLRRGHEAGITPNALPLEFA